MSDSLDHFVRDAMKAHDGMDTGDLPTVATGGPVKSARPAQRRDDALGTVPGHEMKDFIARGGMGAVYRAKQMALGREVAVKVMTAEAESPEMAERFRREAMVLGKLEHPNIVPIHDLGTDADGQLFYTMKLVKGRTLQHILNDLRLEHPDALREHRLPALLTIFRKVCDAIGFAHSQGVIHRDLKPENVMVGEFGEVLVMDWGLAKLLRSNDEIRMTNDEVSSRDEEHSSFVIHHSSFSATLAGSVMGTPQYMSPEQAWGMIDDLDARSDIFSLGGILYAILTLRPPVEGKTLEEVLEKVRTATITPPTAFGAATVAKGAKTKKGEVLEARKITPLPHITGGRVPAALSAVAMKSLRVVMEERYQSVTELSDDIEKYQGGFATSAEQAGALKQLKLLMLRHKAVTASLAVMVLLSIGFVIKVMASERKATHNAEIAQVNEQRANENAEESRRSLARAQIAIAEAAFRSGYRNMLVQSLDAVPDDLRDQTWSYLSAKRDASLGALSGARDVACVAAVPGQPETFVLAGIGGVLSFVNARTGEQFKEIKTSLSGAIALAFNSDGTLIAVTAKNAKEILIIRASDGAVQRQFPAPAPAINRLVFSPDAAVLACGEPTGTFPNGRLTVIGAADGKIRWQAKQTANGIDFSPDGSRMFVSSEGAYRFFRVFQTETGRVLKEAVANAYCQAMSMDRKFLAVGLQNGVVVIYDVATGDELRRAKLYNGDIQAVSWMMNDHLLTSGSDGDISRLEKNRRVLRLWETRTFSPRGTFFGLKQGSDRTGWSYQPASGWLVTDEATPQRWMIAVNPEAARLTLPSEQGWSLAFLSDTTLLSRKAWDLLRYDVSNPREPRPQPPLSENGEVICVVNRDADLVAMAKGIGSPPFLLKLHANDAALTKKWEIKLPGRALGLDFDDKGGRLLTVTRDSDSAVYDTQDGKVLLKMSRRLQRGFFSGSAGNIAAVVRKQDSVGEIHDSIVVFDAKTGAQLREVPQSWRVNAMSVSADRQLIAVGGDEQFIIVLDANTLEEKHRFRAHDDDIRALAFHPREPVIASASNDGTLKLWEYETASLRRTCYGLGGPPVALAFSPNGRLLALEAQENFTRVFDLASSPEPADKPVQKQALQPDAEGWLDLLGAANAEYVAAAGSGWLLENGELHSTRGGYAIVPLSFDRLPENFTLRITVRRTEPANEFAIFFPVGERNIGFNFDMWPPKYGSVLAFGGASNLRRDDIVWGQKFADTEKHTVELTVKVNRPTAKIDVLFDGKPHYQWSGPIREISRSAFWSKAANGAISVGCNNPHWNVSEAKLKPLP